VAGWCGGTAVSREKTPSDRQREALTGLRFARAAGIHFQSVANQARYVMSRDALGDSSRTLSPDQRSRLESITVQCLTSETVLARELLTLAQEDSRLGFEPTCHDFYLSLDLVEKVVSCHWLLEHR
jgi:hypothetical protein